MINVEAHAHIFGQQNAIILVLVIYTYLLIGKSLRIVSNHIIFWDKYGAEFLERVLRLKKKGAIPIPAVVGVYQPS